MAHGARRHRGGGARRIPGLSRAVGTAAGSTIALALLVSGCVFAAVAGPALSLHTQSQALHQTLAGLATTTSAVQVAANWGDFTGALIPLSGGNPQPISRPELEQTTREVAQGFGTLRLPLAVGGTWWAGLSTRLFVVSGAGPRAQAALRPQLAVYYRDPLTINARLVAGTYADTRIPRGTVGVAATTQTAYRFGLHPGSRLSLDTPSGAVRLFVTAIVAERVRASTFWTQDSTMSTPSLSQPATYPYWVGGVIADPGQLTAMQDTFSGPGLELYWEFPLDVRGVTAAGVRGLFSGLNRVTTEPPALTGALVPSADTMTVSSPLISNLSAFLDTQAAIETVLLLLFVSLIVTGAAVIVIDALMIVARRPSSRPPLSRPSPRGRSRPRRAESGPLARRCPCSRLRTPPPSWSPEPPSCFRAPRKARSRYGSRARSAIPQPSRAAGRS